MRHTSIPVTGTMEIIEGVEISPLISRCKIKVLYVDEEKPCRNNVFITKEVATEMGKKLPGSPIVGCFDNQKGDFLEHERGIAWDENDEPYLIDLTKAYGFVPTDAKVWFQTFLDDDSVQREYLCTEGIIWTTIYPESERIIKQGNNQSMELDPNSMKGVWAKNSISGARFFIINEAIISKLCILGDDEEPCFEGAQINSEFSLKEEFENLKNNLYSMMNEFKEAMTKGGSESPMEIETTVVEVETPETEEPTIEVNEESTVEETHEETTVEEFKNKEEDEDNEEEPSEEDEEEDDEKKKKGSKYSLDEIPEYVELLEKYSALETANNELQTSFNALNEEVTSLRQFKADTELAEKQNMIAKFYMLSDEDKKDVVENIDKYSLDEIEAKLCVIGVRAGIDFSIKEEEEEEDDNSSLTFSVDTHEDDNLPEWIKAVKKTEETIR